MVEELAVTTSISSKVAQIIEAMRERGSLLIAFSGGLDSSLVAKLAKEAVGEKALAVTVDSESLPRRELEEAKRLAEEIGISHRIISYSELQNEPYVANTPERCYHCRKALSSSLKAVAREEGYETVADGVLFSDYGDYRPGIRAADEHGIWHPLAEYGITKDEAREMAKRLGLSVYDKPSMACLASRIPYGSRITIEKLKQIERAEDILKELGFRQVRVRHHGEIARLEVSKEETPKLLDPEMSQRISKELKKLGFCYVTVDLEGYRTGSMNEPLQD